MNLYQEIIHYGAIALSTMITGFAVASAQGSISKSSINALNRQPACAPDITRATLLALALTETAALLGFLGSILLFSQKTKSIEMALAQIGITLAISVPGLIIGIVSAYPASSAMISIARQPFLSKKITNLMLLTQSLLQTPIIFGFIIALVIVSQLNSIVTIGQSLAFIASGLCIAFGSLGPALGVGHFAQHSCENAGKNKNAFSKLISFTIISQAIIETPIIFATVISFWLIKIASSPLSIERGIIALSVAFAMGIGTYGPGISSGKIAASASDMIVQNQAQYGILSRTSMIAQGLIDTCAIYAFIISLCLIIVSMQ